MKLDRESIAFLIFSYLMVHFFVWSVYLGLGRVSYSYVQGSRFILTKSIPIALFASLFIISDLRKILSVPLFRHIAEFFMSLFAISGLVLFLAGLVRSIPFINLFSLKWTYHAFITYYLFFLVFYIVLKYRCGTSKLESLIISFLLVYLAGHIYEIPLYYQIYLINPSHGVFYHFSHPFIIEFRWILPFLLIWYFRRASYKIKYYWPIVIFPSFSLLFANSIFYAMDKTLLGGWIWRIPTVIFFTVSLLLMEKAQDDKIRCSSME